MTVIAFSVSNIKAVIKTDTVWLDSDFNGYEERIVDGSESTLLMIIFII